MRGFGFELRVVLAALGLLLTPHYDKLSPSMSAVPSSLPDSHNNSRWQLTQAAWGQTTLNLPTLGDPASEELSPQLERKVGESIMASLRANRDISEDAETTFYLNQLGAQLATQAAAGYSFQFFLVKENSLNAFALPGGYIGVHSGLILAAQNESELAGVLAHEIGHVTQRHIARMLGQGKRGTMVTLATLALAALAASRSPDAAAALALGGQAAQIQNQLSFNREAEREADRVGFQLLDQAGFNSDEMASFFGRLQQNARFYDGNAPAYLRTHPITLERMADMQNRQRPRQTFGSQPPRRDESEFNLIRARMAAYANLSVDGLQQAKRQFEEALALSQDKTRPASAGTTGPRSASLTKAANLLTQLPAPALSYGLALIAAEQRQWQVSNRLLTTAKERLGRDHPLFVIQQADNELRLGQAAQGLRITEAGLKMFNQFRPLLYQHIRLLQANQQHAQALALLNRERELYRQDAPLYALSAESYLALNQRSAAALMTAEYYVLQGTTAAALEQLQLARRANDGDYYQMSIIDARTRQIQERLREERELLK
ncbi:M48 family metalloprotease [Parvibium lacunae]|uniref:M48 family peptidase n=1 Tax=Parvibium lacunae TaxID=1888893 RepID=A0A368L245_9BURK|nr:M48 family metalloprotease [Parvibium lacunae]RCS57460.1 M48 family peptidase [Parvibium lacunae]